MRTKDTHSTTTLPSYAALFLADPREVRAAAHAQVDAPRPSVEAAEPSDVPDLRGNRKRKARDAGRDGKARL